jgi:hypothetical protein
MQGISNNKKTAKKGIPYTLSLSIEERMVFIANLIIDRLEDDSTLWSINQNSKGVKDANSKQNS